MGKIICPADDFDEVDLYPRDIDAFTRVDFSLFPVSFSRNWARDPRIIDYYDKTVIYEFDPKRTIETCPDSSDRVEGFAGGRVIINYEPGFIPRISIHTESIADSRRKSLIGYYFWLPYRAILVQSSPFPETGLCSGPSDGISPINHLGFFLVEWQYGPSGYRFFIPFYFSKVWDMVSSVFSSSNDRRVPRGPRDIPFGNFASFYKIRQERGEPKPSEVYEEDRNEFAINFNSAIPELLFYFLVAAHYIVSLYEVLTGVLPEKVFLPVGCDWIEYDLDLTNEFVSSGTMWIKHEDCNGIRFIPYPDFTEFTPFSVEWPEDPPLETPDEPPEDAPEDSKIAFNSAKALLEDMSDPNVCSTDVLIGTNYANWNSVPYYMEIDITNSQELATKDNPIYGPLYTYGGNYPGCLVVLWVPDDNAYGGGNQHEFLYRSQDDVPEQWESDRASDTGNPPPQGDDDCQVRHQVQLLKDGEVVSEFTTTIPNLVCKNIVKLDITLETNVTIGIGDIEWKTQIRNSF